MNFSRTGIIILVICLSLTNSFAQGHVDFFTAVKKDSVFIFLKQTLKTGENILIERKGPDDVDFIVLSEPPIEPVLDPFLAQKTMGDAYPMVRDACQAKDAQSVLLKLRTDDFLGMVFSMLDWRVARVLGRYFAAGDHQIGENYVYRITLLEKDGKIIDSAERRIKITEKPPEKTAHITVEQKEEKVYVDWNFPDWTGDYNDLTIKFNIERKTENGEYQIINDKLYPRIEGDFYHFVDESVKENKSYTYRLRAVDVAGLTGGPSNEVTILVKDLIPPSIPIGLTAETPGKQVVLSWKNNQEPDMAFYNIYRVEMETSDSLRINKNPVPYHSPGYEDKEVKLKHTYYYSVVAVDSAGNESKPSSQVHVLVTDTKPPDVVTNLKAKVENRIVTVQWTAPQDKDLLGFRISRSLAEGSFFPLNEEYFIDTLYVDRGSKTKTLGPGRHYFYSVKAVDSLYNESDPAGLWVVIPDDEPPSPAGQIVVENVHGRYLKVAWNKSPSPDVEKYHLFRSINDVEEEVDYFNKSSRSFIDRDVQKGQTIIYAVTAIDTAGNESGRKMSYPEQVRDFDLPACPRYVAAYLLENGVKVKWDPVGGFDIAGYNVYRSNLPTGVEIKLNTTPLDTLYLMDTQGTKDHWYWVKSVDTSGNESQKSKPIKVTVRRQ